MDLLLILAFATPVVLAALGETINEKAGLINIGIEGMMLAAAYAGAMVSLSSGSVWLGLLAGVLTGVAGSLISGFFCIRLAADQVVVGAAVNLLAIGATNTLFRARFGQSGELLSVPGIPSWARLDVVLALAALLVPAVWFLLSRTSWGLVVRAAGEYPSAVEASGFDVVKLRFQATAIAGALAGLGGAYLSLGIVRSFSENMTNGRGFVAIALVTFGRWNPWWVFAAAIFIGFLESLQFWLQSVGSAAPYELLIAMPYVAALLVLVVAGRGRAAPAALALPFRRER